MRKQSTFGTPPRRGGGVVSRRARLQSFVAAGMPALVDHGFPYRHGRFTTIDDPAAAAGTTMASGINDRGVIVGGYQDKITGKNDGFELRPAR